MKDLLLCFFPFIFPLSQHSPRPSSLSVGVCSFNIFWSILNLFLVVLHSLTPIKKDQRTGQNGRIMVTTVPTKIGGCNPHPHTSTHINTHQHTPTHPHTFTHVYTHLHLHESPTHNINMISKRFTNRFMFIHVIINNKLNYYYDNDYQAHHHQHHHY